MLLFMINLTFHFILSKNTVKIAVVLKYLQFLSGIPAVLRSETQSH